MAALAFCGTLVLGILAVDSVRRQRCCPQSLSGGTLSPVGISISRMASSYFLEFVAVTDHHDSPSETKETTGGAAVHVHYLAAADGSCAKVTWQLQQVCPRRSDLTSRCQVQLVASDHR